MLSETFPDQVMSEVIGQTHEGRDIKVYHLYSSKNDEGEKKKTIVLTSGIHAREWISVSSLLFLLYQLLMNKDKPAEDYFLNHLDFLIVPVMNPDGYVYTWKHDRLWRKTDKIRGFLYVMALTLILRSITTGVRRLVRHVGKVILGKHRLKLWRPNISVITSTEPRKIIDILGTLICTVTHSRFYTLMDTVVRKRLETGRI